MKIAMNRGALINELSDAYEIVREFLKKHPSATPWGVLKSLEDSTMVDPEKRAAVLAVWMCGRFVEIEEKSELRFDLKFNIDQALQIYRPLKKRILRGRLIYMYVMSPGKYSMDLFIKYRTLGIGPGALIPWKSDTDVLLVVE